MILDRLLSEEGASAAGVDVFGLIESLFPICRSITGNGVRRTLELVAEWVPLRHTEVPSGTQIYDWEVPMEWNIRDAYVADERGRRVVDFRAHNLHVVNYSRPVRRKMTLEELQPHLHSIAEHPDWIPYRTSYYREYWGFCLSHREREKLAPGTYEVVIDSDLAPGSLTFAECVIPGSTGQEAIVYTHTCHPSLANDNLTGVAVAAALAREMRKAKPRLTWRFVFGPGTIGSLAWLAANEKKLERVRAGLVIGLLGDCAPLTYKRSRSGSALTDRAAQHVLQTSGCAFRIADFEPYGYDERQFCSPGFDLPVGRMTRSPNGAYPEYHTSADNLALIDRGKISEALRVLARLLSTLDSNRVSLNLSPKGEPRLGKRGLYGSVGGTPPGAFEHALLWVLNQSDGKHDLIEIAERSGLPYETIDRAATDLERTGLLHWC